MPPPALSGYLDINNNVVKAPQECPVTKTCFLGTPASTNFSINSKLMSGKINSVIFPGSDGSFQVLNNHAPIVSTLKKGQIIIKGEVLLEDTDYMDIYKIKSDKEKTSLQIESGLMEMKKNSIKVLVG